MEIKSFSSQDAQKFCETGILKKSCKLSFQKIDMIIFADSHGDLELTISNRLKMLKWVSKEHWSIGINSQFRILSEQRSWKFF